MRRMARRENVPRYPFGMQKTWDEIHISTYPEDTVNHKTYLEGKVSLGQGVVIHKILMYIGNNIRPRLFGCSPILIDPLATKVG
jgi:hypothetical protein